MPDEFPLEISSVQYMEQVIGSPKMREAFAAQLKKELGHNNLEFVDAVAEFREMARRGGDAPELAKKGKEIYEKFVQPDTKLEVNLPAVDVFNPLKADYENIDNLDVDQLSVMFDKADKSNKAMMSMDSFARFRGSDAFTEARDQTNASVKVDQARIKQLQARGEELATNKWERFKAFFKGGADKMQKEILAEIDKTQMQILQKTDPQKFETLQREKEKMVAKLDRKQDQLAPKVAQYEAVKSAVIMDRLEAGGMTVGKMSTKERLENEKLVKKAPMVEAAVKESEKIDQLKAEVSGSLKVGDSMKGKLGTPSQGQQGPKLGR